MKISKSMQLIAVIMLSLVLVISACSSSNNSNPGTTKESKGNSSESNESVTDQEDGKLKRPEKKVQLTMYLPGDPPRDVDLIVDELNKKMEEDINATVKVNYISWADLQTKYPLLLASGEKFDLIYTANWAFFKEEAPKGGFLALNDLLPIYAPVTYSEMPEEAWKQSSIDGKIFMIPTDISSFIAHGIMFREDLRKNYHVPPIETAEDFGVYLEAIKNNEPSMIPYNIGGTDRNSMIWWITRAMSDNVYSAVDGTPFYYLEGNPTEIFLPHETAEYELFAKQQSDWSAKGYWSKSVLSNQTSARDALLNGTSAAAYMNQVDANIQAQKILELNPDWELDWFLIGGLERDYPQAPYIQDGMAINARAANPERALMLLELLRNDPTYFELTTYGIEGVHYVKTAEGKHALPEGVSVEDNGFPVDSFAGWGWKTEKNVLQPAKSWPRIDELNGIIRGNLFVATLNNFTANTDTIGSELTAIQNEIKQYADPINFGLVPVEESIATLKQKVKDAGLEKARTELQKQIKEYLARL